MQARPAGQRMSDITTHSSQTRDRLPLIRRLLQGFVATYHTLPRALMRDRHSEATKGGAVARPGAASEEVVGDKRTATGEDTVEDPDKVTDQDIDCG